jgi:hypothetical protein
MLDGRPYHLGCAEELMADLARREEYPDHGPTDPWRTSGPGFGT